MTDHSPGVAILPYGTKLGLRPGSLPLDQMIWPLGQPERLKGQRLRDLSGTDHLVVFPSDLMHHRPGFGTKAQVSVLLLEPEAIHRRHYRLLRSSHRRFHKVFTCSDQLIADIPNGVLFPFGGAWVPNWQELTLEKTAMCSLIASAKRSQEGHILRHETVEWLRNSGIDVDVMGGGYRRFDAKSDGLASYRYSVVIENVRERNYFTEKLVDALLCKTVPIYWGCPNIEDFFDTSGMVICQSAKDIQTALRAMSKDDYTARLPALTAMQDRASTYGDIYKRAAQMVLA